MEESVAADNKNSLIPQGCCVCTNGDAHWVNGTSEYLLLFFSIRRTTATTTTDGRRTDDGRTTDERTDDGPATDEKNSDEKIRTKKFGRKKMGGKARGARHGRCGGKARVINGDSWGAKPPRPPQGARHRYGGASPPQIASLSDGAL